jgi:hypothetical protein
MADVEVKFTDNSQSFLDKLEELERKAYKGR